MMVESSIRRNNMQNRIRHGFGMWKTERRVWVEVNLEQTME